MRQQHGRSIGAFLDDGGISGFPGCGFKALLIAVHFDGTHTYRIKAQRLTTTGGLCGYLGGTVLQLMVDDDGTAAQSQTARPAVRIRRRPARR